MSGMTEEEHKMIKEVHDWLLKPPIAGKPTRAVQLDDIMAAIRAGKLGGRAMLWIAGAIAALLAAWAQIKGAFK